MSKDHVLVVSEWVASDGKDLVLWNSLQELIAK